ncbi:MAG: type IV pilus assembly protein PilE [Oleiphilaceae bacterium]|jgi:type IV pilus assembly protein PilE
MAKFKGFSLIELLIVVTIIGILATVAIPSYSKQVAAVKRADGKTTLMAVQSKMERYIFDHNTYPASLAMMSAYSTDSIISTEGYYEINIVAESTNCPIASCYVLRGIPNVNQGREVGEAELLLSSNGTRSGAW